MATDRKIALVTGAGSGIGRAAALALAKAGYALVLVGRKREKLDSVAEQIAALGADVLLEPGNVAAPDDVERIFASIESRFGRLDVLFNNAGVSAPKVSIEEVELRHWNRVLEVNVTGAFLCTQAAFKIMKRQSPRGGRIINNGSVSSHSPRPNGAPYTTSKHAVTGLTKQTSLDGRPYDIACGQIDIGNAGTESSGGLAAGMLQPNGQVVPEPIMDIASVADAVAFMAGLPLDSNVQSMTILATKMPFIGRG